MTAARGPAGAPRPARPRFAVLAEPGDGPAHAVAAQLEARHAGAVVAVDAERLSVAARWRHEQRGGETRTAFWLPECGEIELGEVGVVLNRVRTVTAAPFPRAEDREYAGMEAFAFLLAALAWCARPVVNRPGPDGLPGPTLGSAQWIGLAQKEGIPVRGIRVATSARQYARPDWSAVSEPDLTPLDSIVPPGRRPVVQAEPVAGSGADVLVAGDEVIGAPDPAWVGHCRALARRAGCAVLSVRLSRRARGGAWMLDGADPAPAAVSPPGIEAIVRLLERLSTATAA